MINGKKIAAFALAFGMASTPQAAQTQAAHPSHGQNGQNGQGGQSGQTTPPPPLSYRVLESIGLQTGRLMVPDQILPPPGPTRDALQGNYSTRAIEYRHYRLLLQNEAGEYAQCAGLSLTTNFSYYDQNISKLNFDLVVNDRDLLQILRRMSDDVMLPAYMGACTPLTAIEARGLTDNILGIRIGFTVEAHLNLPLYGYDTAEETRSKSDIVQQGRGVSLRWATGRCAGAGWNPSLSAAQIGDDLTLRALCPR